LFDRVEADLEKHLETERAASQRQITSAQDLQLVALIEGADVVKAQLRREDDRMTEASESSIRPWSQLQRLVRRRLVALIGETSVKPVLGEKHLDVIRALQESQASRIVSDRINVNQLRKAYEAAKGNIQGACMDPLKKPMQETPPSDDNAAAKALYKPLQKACKDLGELMGKERANRAFGLNLDTLGGDFKLVTTELLRLEQQQAELKAAKEVLKKELEKLEKEYKEALANAEKHPDSQEFQDSLKEKAEAVTKFLEALDPGVTGNRDGSETKVAEVVAKVMKLTNGAIDLSGVEMTVGIGAEYIGKLLQAEILETNLKSLLSQAIDQTKKPEDEKEERSQIYWLLTIRIIDVFSRLEDSVYAPANVPSPNALLIAMAFQRYRQDVAKLDEALVEGTYRAKRLEQQAQLEEIYQLWQAHKAAEAMAANTICGREAWGFSEFVDDCKKKGASGRNGIVQTAKALIAYDQAWSLGLNNSTTASLAASGLRQEYSVEMAQANAKAWFDILNPALQELVAYGEGGIKQETIANIIHALGLGAIAWGVNN
jgi:hypothetical protein